MKSLIVRLKDGVPSTIFQAKAMDRTSSLRQLKQCSQDMKTAGEKLEQANKIIEGLLKDDATFGDKEAALQWLEDNR